MLAAYKITVDHYGRAYVLDEIYQGKDNGGEGLIVSAAAQEIKKLIGADNIKEIYAPPDLWNRQKDTGKSIAQLFYEHGVKLNKVSNSRVAGWLNLKEWLKVYADEKGEAVSDIRIFPCCKNLIRAMSELQVDKKDYNECSDSPHELTHAPDALRYFVSGRPVKAKTAQPLPKYDFSFQRPKKDAAGYGDKINFI
jgi:phage terminase large subunit